MFGVSNDVVVARSDKDAIIGRVYTDVSSLYHESVCKWDMGGCGDAAGRNDATYSASSA